jgi:hypothetical protein
MLTKTAPKQLDLSSPKEIARSAGILAFRKIWLPKLLYDCIPYFYLAAGFAAFFATLYISDWFWVVPHYLLFSAACLHLSFAVYRMRKRGNRPKSDERDQADYDKSPAS